MNECAARGNSASLQFINEHGKSANRSLRFVLQHFT